MGSNAVFLVTDIVYSCIFCYMKCYLVSGDDVNIGLILHKLY